MIAVSETYSIDQDMALLTEGDSAARRVSMNMELLTKFCVSCRATNIDLLRFSGVSYSLYRH